MLMNGNLNFDNNINSSSHETVLKYTERKKKRAILNCYIFLDSGAILQYIVSHSFQFYFRQYGTYIYTYHWLSLDEPF